MSELTKAKLMKYLQTPDSKKMIIPIQSLMKMTVQKIQKIQKIQNNYQTMMKVMLMIRMRQLTSRGLDMEEQLNNATFLPAATTRRTRNNTKKSQKNLKI
jgi:hypothetical protein